MDELSFYRPFLGLNDSLPGQIPLCAHKKAQQYVRFAIRQSTFTFLFFAMSC